MEIALAWVVFSYLCGKYGEKKGLSFTKFFWISLLISPVVGFIWCALSMEDMDMVEEKKIITKQSKRCPYCKELIKVGASICKHCQKDLNKKTLLELMMFVPAVEKKELVWYLRFVKSVVSSFPSNNHTNTLFRLNYFKFI